MGVEPDPEVAEQPPVADLRLTAEPRARQVFEGRSRVAFEQTLRGILRGAQCRSSCRAERRRELVPPEVEVFRRRDGCRHAAVTPVVAVALVVERFRLLEPPGDVQREAGECFTQLVETVFSRFLSPELWTLYESWLFLSGSV